MKKLIKMYEHWDLQWEKKLFEMYENWDLQWKKTNY